MDSTRSSEDTRALDASDRFYQFWWVIALLAVLGGGGGYLARILQPVTYDAQTLMLVSLNYNKIDFMHPPAPTPVPYVISQADEDGFLNIVIDCFNKAAPKVADFARQNGYQVDQDELLKQSEIDREHAYWEVHTRNPNPVMAQKLADYWAQMVYADLQARQKAGAINPGIFYEIVQPARLPTSPYHDRMNVFVLTGAAIGLGVGILLVSRPFFRKAWPGIHPVASNGEFIFRYELSRLWRYGWVVALLTALGVMGGWMVHLAKPPIYEAQADLSAKIDYKKLLYMIAPSYDPTPNQITFYDEDLTLVIMDAALRGVVPQVAEHVQQNGEALDEAELLDHVTIERKETSFQVNFRDADPAVAQDIANTWAQLGLAALQAKQSSGAYPDYVSAQMAQQAYLPQKPAYFRPEVMAVAGGVIGLIASLLLVNLPFFERMRKR